MLPDVKGVDSTKQVAVPLDVMLRYYFRAVRVSSLWPEGTRLAWLRAHDEAERTVWVDRYRNSQDSLGVVVQAVTKERDAHWVGPLVAGKASTSSSTKRRSRSPSGGSHHSHVSSRKGSRKRSKKDKKKSGKAKRWLAKTRGGESLCKGWNSKAGCKDGKKCTAKHRCNGELSSSKGKACGEDHPSYRCTNEDVDRD